MFPYVPHLHGKVQMVITSLRGHPKVDRIRSNDPFDMY